MPQSEPTARRAPAPAGAAVAAVTATAAALVALAVVTAAAAAPAEHLTLARALTLAREDNLSLQASHEDYEAAEWGVKSAAASLGPSITFSSTATRVDPDTYRRANSSLAFLEDMGIQAEPFLYETTYETSFNATFPLYNGQLWGAFGAASASRDAAYHAYESTQRGVEYQTKQAYLAVLRAESLVGVARDAVAATRRNVEKAQRKFEIGSVPKAEVLRWEVVLANDEKATADAGNALVLSMTQLSDVIGRPLDSEFSLETLTRIELDLLRESYAWLLDEGALTEERGRELLATSPEFLALADAARVSEAGISIARGAFLPSVYAGGSYGWRADDDISPDDDTAWSVRLGLELPIFTSLKNVSDYQRSKRSYLASLRRQENVERALIGGLRNSLASVTSNMKGLDAAETQVAQAEDNLANVRNRNDQGMAPYIEFVDARVTYDRSRVGYVNALFDAYLAFADVERLLGERRFPESGETR